MTETELTVLVPGAAGSSAIGAIKALRQACFRGRIITTDGESLSAGFFLSDAHYVNDTITDSNAYRRLVEILLRERVGVVLPTSASEVPVYALRKSELLSMGVLFAGSDKSVVTICDDKLLFYDFVKNSFPVPSMIGIKDGSPSHYPCFAKPRFGSGSRGCGICTDPEDWHFLRKRTTELLVQEVLPGKEFSVDVLSDLSGNPLVAVPRERITIMDGVSVRARVLKEPNLEDLCLRMALHLGIKGPSCMQLKEDNEGRLAFLEVNARLGGSSIMTSLAGVNMARCLIAMALGERFDIPAFREVTVIRHFDEVVVQ